MIIPPLVEKFLNSLTRHHNPSFAIKDKSKPEGLYKVLSFFAKIFNKNIDTDYVTILSGDCWVPSKFFETQSMEASLIALAHETLHEFDRKRLGSVAFFFLYSTPQILALFSLLAILALWFGPGWLVCLGFLLFLAPVPSPGRMWMELRAYRVNMMLYRHMWRWNAQELEAEANNTAEEFVGGSYYWMWPFRKYIVKALLDETAQTENIYVEILNFFINEGMVYQPKVLPFAATILPPMDTSTKSAVISAKTVPALTAAPPMLPLRARSKRKKKL